jgi:hypothetical protein
MYILLKAATGVTYESLNDPEFMRIAREFHRWTHFTINLTLREPTDPCYSRYQ